MKSSTTTSQAGHGSTSQRTGRRRTVLVAAAVILVLVVAGFVHVVHGGNGGLKLCAKHGWALGDTFVDLDDYGDSPVSNSDNVEVLGAMFECGAIRHHAHEDAEAARQRGPSPAEQSHTPRPALPPALPAAPALPAEPAPSAGTAQARLRLPTPIARKLTETRVQKYVHEAYPAWRQAHPGEECPHQLSELTEYMEDKDVNDGWGRPLRMFCSATRPAGARQIKVFSLGRDAERGTEDDIMAEE